MPKRNGVADRERRRLAAEARQAAAMAAERAAMTPEELRAHNANLAAQKAAHEEGLGHFHPELRPVELVPLKHISQYQTDHHGRVTPDPTAEHCPIVECLRCLEERQDELSSSIRNARISLAVKRKEKAKRMGLNTVSTLTRAGY